MPKYVSILRGINVSGRKKILMADLKVLCEKIGFTNVKTYIQSGNVAFDIDDKNKKLKGQSDKELAEKIVQAISKQYDFDVPVIVMPSEEMQSTIETNPFLIRNKEIDPKKLYVTFLADEPDSDKLDKLNEIEYPPDEFEVIGKKIFVYCPEKYGETKLSNGFFERKLKLAATTRNWRTVNKIIELTDT